MQQRDARARRALHLGHEDHRAAVACGRGPPAPRARWRRGAWYRPGCALRSTRLGTSRDSPPRSTIEMTASCARVALDAVAGEADDRLDGGIEIGEHLQRAVRQPVARRAGRQRLLHQRPVEHALVAAADADGDRLGLVLDRVDRSGELLDRARQRRGEIVDEHAGRGELAGAALVRLERRCRWTGRAAGRPAGPRSTPRGGRRRCRCAGRRRTARRAGAMPCLHASQHVVAAGAPSTSACSMTSRASRSGRADASIASAAS